MTGKVFFAMLPMFFPLKHGTFFGILKRTEKDKAGESMNTDYIAVFDSGVGGISVLRELMKQMPDERYLYYGDSANAPYGDKSTQQVQALTLTAAEKLMTRGVKALVVACNTATAAAINLLRQTYPDKIIIGIEPALKVAAERFPRGRVGIMATQVTLREEKLAQQVDRFPELEVYRIPAPGLVELVEQGKGNTGRMTALLQDVLTPWRGKLDALVLGCTHYPLVKEEIAHVLGDNVLLLDGGEGTARQTRRCLEQGGLLHDGPGSLEMENSLPDEKILELSRKLLKGV